MVLNSEITFVRLLIPLLLGICIFYHLESVFWVSTLALLLFFISISLVGINICYKIFRIYRFKYIVGILFFLLFIAFGGILCLLKKSFLRHNYFGNYTYQQLKIRINDMPQNGNHTIRFTADVVAVYHQQKRHITSGKLIITVKTDSLAPIALTYGDELIINANCTFIMPPFNPGEFDFKGWLATKNIYLQTIITQDNIISIKSNQGNPVLSYALNLRDEQIAIYKKIIKDKEALAVASTLILGYRADLSSETLSSFSKTGTIHALSVSGMHVGIIYVVLNYLLSFMDRKKKQKILKVVTICTLIWFYSLLTGFSPSVLRSAIMLTIYILAKAFNKDTNGYNILAFTAFCLLLYNPFLILDVGFQLSFLAVLGLIYLHPKIYKWLYFKQGWADWIWSSVTLSIAAQITTFPLSIYYFHQFPVYFIFSNLFILIPITLLMYLGISILLLKLYFLGPIFEWLIIFMNSGLKWIANLPFSGINQIWIDKVQLVCLSLSLILGLIALSKFKKKILLTAMSLLLIFQSSLSLYNIKIKTQRKIIFFSLERGYAAAFINSQTAILLSNLTLKDKNFLFYIQPALEQLHIKNTHFIKWKANLNLNSFKKSNHQINFSGYRILLLDNYFDNRLFDGKPIFNTLWLHYNPKVQISKFRKSAIFKTLIIDASNFTSQIKHYTSEANKIQVSPHILKKNKAYLIDLNNMPDE